MVKHFEHVTIAARDVDAAKRFFALLGFEEEISTVIKGPTMDAHMGVPATASAPGITISTATWAKASAWRTGT